VAEEMGKPVRDGIAEIQKRERVRLAVTMIRHDPSAGLFVPIELLFNETPDGGCAVTYVVPSSLIAIDDNASLLAAAKRLDDKLEALMVSALG
jgi:hypothetical protein